MAPLYVNLGPRYQKTSSGMEVGEVMEGEKTTYGFTLSFLFHIALCICVRGCLTWLGTVLQMGSEIGFQTWFWLAIHPVRHALLLWQHCSDCFCLLCCTICRGGGENAIRIFSHFPHFFSHFLGRSLSVMFKRIHSSGIV